MGYDRSFYLAYHRYLKERTVRGAHDAVFRIARLDPAFKNVIDLGCGQFNEFLRYRRPVRYVGIDVNATPKRGKTRNLIAADYRDLSTVKAAIAEHACTAFVSLFSTEITAGLKTNYEYYRSLFEIAPTLQSGLVSGFYYFNSKTVNPIGETGGIQSFQTLEPIESVLNDTFAETRILLPVPSAMFGPDVIEVWKLLTRK